MTSSKKGFPNVPPPQGAKTSVYSRFIPREEVSSFAAWQPGAFGGDPAKSPTGAERRKDPQPDPELIARQIQAARQSGYQDGYRDGLAALETFKQNFATQLSAQLGLLTASYGEQFDLLQQDMARALAVTATHLARQIVRSELAQRPELIATVAQEAVDRLVLSAQHISVRVHPDDHPLVMQGAADALAARGARVVSDPQVQRGGCIVESDIGVVDASIETRWNRACASLGCEESWAAASTAAAPAIAVQDDIA